MIYTVTFNPALDYIVRLGKLSLGEVNTKQFIMEEKELMFPLF